MTPSTLALSLLAAAQAGMFNEKTMRQAWPAQQVRRAYVLPKGWLQVAITADEKTATETRGRAGGLRPLTDGTAFRYTRTWLRIDQGFSKRIRLYAHIPLVHARLTSDEGLDIATSALGDVHTGLWLEPWPDHRGGGALQLDLKAPSGVEWPSDFIGGPANTEGFLTGTGITNVGAHLHLRQRLGRIAALRGSAGWVFKLPGVVGYVVESDGFGNGWLDPGDELRLTGEGWLQVTSTVAVGAEGRYSYRRPYRIGVSGPSVTSAELTPIRNSEAAFVDLGASVSWEPNPHLELGLSASNQVAGTWTGLFDHLGLDEFSPLPGWTVGVDVVTRW